MPATEFYDWVTSELAAQPSRVSRIPADAGNRQYLRFHTTRGAFVGCTVPADAADNSSLRQFHLVQSLLRTAGVRVPEIVAIDFRRSWMLMTDVGVRQLSQCATIRYDEPPWTGAMDLLRGFAAVHPGDLCLLPQLDHGTLRERLDSFFAWYLAVAGARPEVRHRLDQAVSDLCAGLAAIPSSFVHLDLHGRNILYSDPDQVGVVDFQDAVRGPGDLDVAALVFDQNVSRSATEVDTLIDVLWTRTADIHSGTKADFRLRLAAAATYWSMYLLGVCTRLSRRDGKARYEQEVTRAAANLRTLTTWSLPADLQRLIAMVHRIGIA